MQNQQIWKANCVCVCTYVCVYVRMCVYVRLCVYIFLSIQSLPLAFHDAHADVFLSILVILSFICQLLFH